VDVDAQDEDLPGAKTETNADPSPSNPAAPNGAVSTRPYIGDLGQATMGEPPNTATQPARGRTTPKNPKRQR